MSSKTKSEYDSALLSWQEEKNSAFLYRYMASAESLKIRQTMFNKLAEAAEAQAKIWE